MTYAEYNTRNRRNAGRKRGSVSRNEFGRVYRLMAQRGLLNGVSRQTFKRLLNLVGDGVWERVYDGHIVAIPGLFNLEVRHNNSQWRRTVDWKTTHRLWSEDEEAFNDRLLVRAKPTTYILHIRRSTIGSKRGWWYYPLLLDIRPSKGKVKQIEDRYML